MLPQFRLGSASFSPSRYIRLECYFVYTQVSLDNGLHFIALFALIAVTIGRCVIGYLMFDRNDTNGHLKSTIEIKKWNIIQPG